MSNYPIHVCKATDEMGDPFRPDSATCGTCWRSWCAACYPTPADLCPFCNGDTPGVEHAKAPIPPRQIREIARLNREVPLESWQRRY